MRPGPALRVIKNQCQCVLTVIRLIKGTPLDTNHMVVKQFRSAGPMTLNNYTQNELLHLRSVVGAKGSKIRYLVFCHEVGTDKGTEHLQIYAQATTKLSLKAWHKQLGKRIAKIQPTRNLERAIKYCQGFKWNDDIQAYEHKEGSGEVEEYGRKPHQGERTDLIGYKHRIEEGESVMHVAESDEMFEIYARNRAALENYSSYVQAKRQREATKKDFEAFWESRTAKMHWEQHLQSILFDDAGKLRPAHPRKIYWYFDTKGETYKTVNAKHLLLNHSTFLITGGKAADIYYTYQYEDIVLYNQCASQDTESIKHLYKVLEEFKDGYFLSTKYIPQPKLFPPKHVIVFANVPPDPSRLKKARLLEVDIQEYEKSSAYRERIAREDSSALQQDPS